MNKKNFFKTALAGTVFAVIALGSCSPEPETVAVDGLTLDSVALTLVIGETHQLKATITPANATDPTVEWVSADTTKVAVTQTGKVTALTETNNNGVDITVRTPDNKFYKNCRVVVRDPLKYDRGVTVFGKKWATRNVDVPGKFTAKPEDKGMFYQWNVQTAWLSEGTSPMASDGTTTWNASSNGGTGLSFTNDPCPTGWKVPTIDDLQTLGSGFWTVKNGQSGREFVDGNNTLFLPAAGFRQKNGGTLTSSDSEGYYWTATATTSYYASYIHFNNAGLTSTGTADRGYAYSIRCIEK